MSKQRMVIEEIRSIFDIIKVADITVDVFYDLLP